MPFMQQLPREYSKATVEAMDKRQIGVYGLFKQGVWVYVGKGDIRQRLLDHLNGDNPCITKFSPTSFMAEITGGDPSERQRQLIEELQPACNGKDK